MKASDAITKLKLRSKKRSWRKTLAVVFPDAIRDTRRGPRVRRDERARKLYAEMVACPLRVYLFDNQIRGFSNQQVTIRQVLGTKFDYAELMSAN